MGLSNPSARLKDNLRCAIRELILLPDRKRCYLAYLLHFRVIHSTQHSATMPHSGGLVKKQNHSIHVVKGKCLMGNFGNYQSSR